MVDDEEVLAATRDVRVVFEVNSDSESLVPLAVVGKSRPSTGTSTSVEVPQLEPLPVNYYR